jgi:hypothetical protein
VSIFEGRRYIQEITSDLTQARDRSHTSEFVRQIQVDKRREESEQKKRFPFLRDMVGFVYAQARCTIQAVAQECRLQK